MAKIRPPHHTLLPSPCSPHWKPASQPAAPFLPGAVCLAYKHRCSRGGAPLSLQDFVFSPTTVGGIRGYLPGCLSTQLRAGVSTGGLLTTGHSAPGSWGHVHKGDSQGETRAMNLDTLTPMHLVQNASWDPFTIFLEIPSFLASKISCVLGSTLWCMASSTSSWGKVMSWGEVMCWLILGSYIFKMSLAYSPTWFFWI